MHRIETPDIIEVQKALQNIESSCQSYGARNLETLNFWGICGSLFLCLPKWRKNLLSSMMPNT